MTGASSGIGYELAKQFAQNGFDLLVTATGPSINEAALGFERLGAKVDTVQTDLATYDGVETLYNKIKATGRPVDAIAINAGVGVGGDFARGTDLKDELNLSNLNVVSTVHLAKRVVKDMVSAARGEFCSRRRSSPRCSVRSKRFTRHLRHSYTPSRRQYATN